LGLSQQVILLDSEHLDLEGQPAEWERFLPAQDFRDSGCPWEEAARDFRDWDHSEMRVAEDFRDSGYLGARAVQGYYQERESLGGGEEA
jgi:hypothetical protein